MTNREKRVLWLFIFWLGLALMAMPSLLPTGNFAPLEFFAGGLLMAAAALKLWRLRRRPRRGGWAAGQPY